MIVLTALTSHFRYKHEIQHRLPCAPETDHKKNEITVVPAFSCVAEKGIVLRMSGGYCPLDPLISAVFPNCGAEVLGERQTSICGRVQLRCCDTVCSSGYLVAADGQFTVQNHGVSYGTPRSRDRTSSALRSRHPVRTLRSFVQTFSSDCVMIVSTERLIN